MILAFALAAAVLFGCGAYLLLKRDLVRVVAGIMLISQSAAGDDHRVQPDPRPGTDRRSTRATWSATRCPRRWRSRRWSSAWPRWRCCSRWCTASSWSSAPPSATSSPQARRSTRRTLEAQRQADREEAS